MTTEPNTIKYSYKHVPTLRKFSESEAFFRCVIGGFGSGKSTACIVEIISRALAQKPGPDGVARTRWLVIRNTYRQLADSTIRSFLQWLPPGQFGTFKYSTNTYTITAFENVEIDISFRALDKPQDVANLLSVEVTGCWLNESREIPWAIVEAVQGRVGRFPPQKDGGPTWYGVIMDSNPSDTDSKLYKYFCEQELDPKYAQLFMQPDGLGPHAENLPNLPGGQEYYKRMAIGKDPEWVKVYCRGEWGYVQDGRPVFPEYYDSTHCAEFKHNTAEPIYRGHDFGLCYDDKTEVLTKAGWKFFKDVDVATDEAATRNPVTKTLEYTKIGFKIEKNYKGEMLQWANREIDFCVTPEHLIPNTMRETPNNIRFDSAEVLSTKLTSHRYVDLTSKWNPEYDIRQTYFGMSPLAFARLAALVLSEGCADPKKNRISVYQRKHLDQFQKWLDDTELVWKRTKPSPTTVWRISHKPLAAFFRKFGKSKQKRVPDEIKAMPPDLIKEFLWAYTVGDGSYRVRKNGATEQLIFTTSPNMANDLQELAQKCGWHSACVWLKPWKSVIKENNTTRVITNTGVFRISFKRRAQRAELQKSAFSRIQYDGKIYCLNVPYHTLYVRRNGKPSWNGNTPSCVFSQLTPNGQFVVFDELVSESMGIDNFSDEINEHSARYYPDATFIDLGDPAGQQRAQTDEKTCFQILHSKGIMIEAGIQSMQIRLESVRKPLTRLVMGKPGFQLHPRCKMLRKGFMGGYQFRRLQTSGERFTSVPHKNQYSHPMDALQYIATRLFGDSLVSPKDMGRGNYADDDMPDDHSRSEVTGY